ncbi:hypothetical protein FNU75_02490 [Proteus mirabilis]|uniref:hypothetical protein n=1 Tax=Proteus mirabilis TaxID=584 RepID=UPI001179F31D|nr:hypothetical protein [Proteus mirabilis]TRY10063.1 hypothetical protein FNU75_02490 [Proteus mirabilis]HAU5547188.1 hypothetical protein [Proteus mirabilis]HAU5581805.1 hypothetical protein [Proteus mirabilis]HAU5585681.1 hypothetical protein [Proteus mirabilis]HCC0205360.1 hypothetical protein [Proteus mirabilis]
MNDEILQIAKYLKNKINAGEGVDEYDWQEIIDVCDELLRINSLEPAGYISEDGLNSLSENSDVITSSKQQYNKVIPLYKLD